MQVIAFMGIRMFLFSIILLSAMAGGNSALAQRTAEQEFQDRVKELRLSQLETSRKKYDAFYQRLLANRLMPYFDDPSQGRAWDVFFEFSKAYTAGSRYDPFGQETITALKDLAVAARSSDNSAKADEFRSLLQWHLPNYTVLESVMPLVRENPALGDIELLEWMHDQITGRLLRNSSNYMEGTAFGVFSIKEADFLLSSKAKRVIDTKVHIGPGDTCYHMHTVENLLPNGPEKIYIQYSLIARHVVDTYEIPTMRWKLPTDPFKAVTPYCMYPFVAPDVPKR